MLIRRFLNASFRLLIKLDWDEDYMELYDLILTGPGGPLLCVRFSPRNLSHLLISCPSSPDDQRIPTSLACHMGDVYLEELEKAINVSEPVSRARWTFGRPSPDYVLPRGG